MPRIVVVRASGQILESQPAAKPGAMLNAIVAGGAYRAEQLIEIDDPLAPSDLAQRKYQGGQWVLRPEIEAAVAAAPIKRAIAALEADLGFTRKQREAMIDGLPPCRLVDQLRQADDAIAVEREKLPEQLRGVRAGG